MTFEEVLPAFRLGKRIRRKTMSPGMYHILEQGKAPLKLRSGYVMRPDRIAHLSRDDWEVMK